MVYNGKEIEFPALMQVSFFKLIEALESQAKGDDAIGATYANSLLEEVKKYPELREGISDLSKIQKYQKSIEVL